MSRACFEALAQGSLKVLTYELHRTLKHGALLLDPADFPYPRRHVPDHPHKPPTQISSPFRHLAARIPRLRRSSSVLRCCIQCPDSFPPSRFLACFPSRHLLDCSWGVHTPHTFRTLLATLRTVTEISFPLDMFWHRHQSNSPHRLEAALSV